MWYSLTATSYVCYLRNIHRLVADSNNMPWRESILRLSPNVLALVVLLSFIGTILLKAYVIGIVWRCYKYLTFRQHNEQLMLPYVIPTSLAAGLEGGGGVGGTSRAMRDYSTLLPGYEEALAQSMKQQPPPSYQAAMSTTPVAAATVATESVVAAGERPAADAAAAPVGDATATGVTVILPPVAAAVDGSAPVNGAGSSRIA